MSDTEKDKVYRLIQEFSHGLDPGSTVEHKDKSEIQGAIKVLMKMVKESDKKHFESLESNLEVGDRVRSVICDSQGTLKEVRHQALYPTQSTW